MVVRLGEDSLVLMVGSSELLNELVAIAGVKLGSLFHHTLLVSQFLEENLDDRRNHHVQVAFANLRNAPLSVLVSRRSRRSRLVMLLDGRGVL